MSIEKELIPYIEKKYPVTNYRTLIGHSYGGLFTINALINHTDLFENYLAIDPSLDWDNQKLLKQSKEVIKSNSLEGKSLIITLSGQLHMQNSNITINNVMQDSSEYTLSARSNIEFFKFAESNKQDKFNIKWKFYKNDLHGTVPLPSILDGLVYFFEWYQMENTDKFNSFDTPKDELYEIIRYRANKLKSHFEYQVPPYPEDLFNMLGYMNMEMQQLEKAKMYFELCIEYYPESTNAYDSMAEYYASQNDFENAIKNIEKALEVNENEYFKNKIEEYKKNEK
jgi:tetratricopeptide (TPR) repeat protein